MELAEDRVQWQASVEHSGSSAVVLFLYEIVLWHTFGTVE
jgi:hypothetical protein